MELCIAIVAMLTGASLHVYSAHSRKCVPLCLFTVFTPTLLIPDGTMSIDFLFSRTARENSYVYFGSVFRPSRPLASREDAPVDHWFLVYLPKRCITHYMLPVHSRTTETGHLGAFLATIPFCTGVHVVHHKPLIRRVPTHRQTWN